MIHVASDEDRGPLTTNFYGGWAPRLGIAYSPDDGRTAIRGAYGISYYRDNFGANGGTLERNHPLFQQIDLQTPTQFVPFRSVSDGLPGFTSVPLTPANDASCIACSAALRSPTSIRKPWLNRGRPSSSRTIEAWSRNHHTVPSFAVTRCSTSRGSPST